MNVQRIRKMTSSWCFALLLAFIPASVFATHFELSRLANQIYALSDQLAHDLRYTRNYGSVRQKAVNLSREASQLVDTLRRNRSNSRVRSRFRDVQRGYERLEQAFFWADRRDHDPRWYQDLHLLSNLFVNLSNEFYYAGYDYQNSGSVYVGSGYYHPHSHSSGVIVRQRERVISPLFRGNNGRVLGRQSRQNAERRELESRAIGRRGGVSETRRRNHYE